MTRVPMRTPVATPTRGTDTPHTAMLDMVTLDTIMPDTGMRRTLTAITHRPDLVFSR